MKKVIILLFLCVLVSCSETTMNTTTNPTTTPTTGQNTNSTTTMYTDTITTTPDIIIPNISKDKPTFPDTTTQVLSAKLKALDTISFYQSQLTNLIGEFSEMSVRKNATSEDDIYTREDFTEYDSRTYSVDYDVEEIINLNMELDVMYQLIDATEGFEEFTYFSNAVSGHSYRFYVYTEENNIYLETYEIVETNINLNQYITERIQVIYFEMRGENVYYEFLRDVTEFHDEEVDHNVYYDQFQENGDSYQIALYKENTPEQSIAYNHYQVTNRYQYSFNFDSTKVGVVYTDVDTQVTYIVSSTLDNQLDHYCVRFYDGYIQLLEIRERLLDHQYKQMDWNLLEVEGWTSVYMPDTNFIELFVGTDSLFTEDRLHGSISAPQSLGVDMDIMDKTLDADLVSLTDYGLSFTKVTFTQLEDALGNLDVENLIQKEGFTFDMEENNDLLLSMFHLQPTAGLTE